MTLAQQASPEALFSAVRAAVLALVDLHHGGPEFGHTPATALARIGKALEVPRG